MRCCQRLFRGAYPQEMTHQEGEVRAGGLDQISLTDVVSTSQGRPPSSTAVKDVLEAPLHLLCSVAEKLLAECRMDCALGRIEGGEIALREPVQAPRDLGIAYDCLNAQL